jgi:hypothetical protein
MAAHEGAVSGRTVLLALLFALMVLSIVMCAYLVGRLVGGQNMGAFKAIGNLLMTTGVIPKETAEALGPGGRVIGKASTPQKTKNRQTASAASLACPTEDPIEEAAPEDRANLDPLQAYDRAAGKSSLAQASNAGDLAASGPLMIPTFVSARSAKDAAAPGSAAAAASGAAAPGAAAPGAAAAAGAAGDAKQAAAAPPPPPIPHLAVPPPAGAAALPPPTLYSVELGFFLSDKAAGDFAAELQKRGIAVNLVTETDESGRSWTYVHSGRFQDSVQAFAYANELSQADNLPGQVVTEKAVPAK